MDRTTVRMTDGVDLHVGVHGEGPDVLVLSGGPGNVHYLESDHLAPTGARSWFPEPRGVGRSGGGAHDIEQALADLEDVRRSAGIDEWTVLGHSWGSDLAVFYALDFPSSVTRVVGVAGHGMHKDRTWSQTYEQGKLTEAVIDIALDDAVWRSLSDSFVERIHRPDLFRALADTRVPMTFLAAANDIRPSWPLQQLAQLVPDGTFDVIGGVPHDLWFTHPDVWTSVVSAACLGLSRQRPRRAGTP